MPEGYGLKCAECSMVTPYKLAKYVEGRLTFLHKMSCSQQYEQFPRMYLSQA